MIYETAFGDWRIEEGTATDLTNKLMWCRSPLGESGVGRGKLVQDSWINMTKLYGRGVNACERSESDTLGEIVRQTIPTSTRDNGYTLGRERMMHAGFSDWCLPTLGEATTLTFAEQWGAKKTKNGEDDCNKIITALFHESCKGLDFCTANKCWDKPLTLELYELFSAKSPPVVWTIDFGHETSIWDSSRSAYNALLVRQI